MELKNLTRTELSYPSAGATRVFEGRPINPGSSDGPRVSSVPAEVVAHFNQLTLETWI